MGTRDRSGLGIAGRAWRRCALVAALLASPAAARAADAPPPGWDAAWAFLVESVCVDAGDHPLFGVSPLDGPARCNRQRKLGIGEALPYRRRDWADLIDRGTHPDGYQQSDSVPVRTALGLAVVQATDFGDAPRGFGRFDPGDGGQVVFFTPEAASIGLTEDGGAGLQFFIGPRCTPLDAWVVVDRSFASQPTGQTVARITRRPGACPDHLGYAFTRWSVQPVTFRDKVAGRVGHTTLTTLVTDHFGGHSVDAAANLERMYFTRELGYTRWERWQNLSRQDRIADRQQAAAMVANERCEPQLGPPSTATRWVMVDCREWTQMVPPLSPGGDRPDFWLDRLRGYPNTRAMFPP